MKLKRGKNKITIKEYAEIRDTFELKETYIDHKEMLKLLDNILNGKKIEEKLVVSRFQDKYCVFLGNQTFQAINNLLDYGLNRIPIFDKDKIFSYEFTIKVDFN